MGHAAKPTRGARLIAPTTNICDTAFLNLLYAPPLRHVTTCCINRFQAASHIGMPFGGGEKMTSAWAQRQAELLSDCIVSPDVFDPMMDRLRTFVVPYQQALETEAGQRNVYL